VGTLLKNPVILVIFLVMILEQLIFRRAKVPADGEAKAGQVA
jgi:hypothetical protein